MLYGRQLESQEIKSVGEVFANEHDCWVVSVANKETRKEIYRTILNHGGQRDKEIDFDELLLQIYEEQYIKWKNLRTDEKEPEQATLILENYNGFIPVSYTHLNRSFFYF